MSNDTVHMFDKSMKNMATTLPNINHIAVMMHEHINPTCLHAYAKKTEPSAVPTSNFIAK